jgi:hypothetical protein
MRRTLAILGLVSIVAAGCRAAPSSPDDGARVVVRTPPPEPPRARRFELVETAVLGSGTDAAREVTISLPIASTDPDVQTIESMLVRITPDQPYDVSQDMDGNRLIRVHCKGSPAISCELTYHVERAPVLIDLSREEKRSLTPSERTLLKRELTLERASAFDPAPLPEGASFRAVLDHDWSHHDTGGTLLVDEREWVVDHLRSRGIPSRAVTGLRLRSEGKAEETFWFEAYLPGAGWIPVGIGPLGQSPDDVLAIVRGSGVRAAEAAGAGKPVPLEVTYRWREAPER